MCLLVDTYSVHTTQHNATHHQNPQRKDATTVVERTVVQKQKKNARCLVNIFKNIHTNESEKESNRIKNGNSMRCKKK